MGCVPPFPNHKCDALSLRKGAEEPEDNEKDRSKTETCGLEWVRAFGAPQEPPDVQLAALELGAGTSI